MLYEGIVLVCIFTDILMQIIMRNIVQDVTKRIPPNSFFNKILKNFKIGISSFNYYLDLSAKIFYLISGPPSNYGNF